MLPKAKHFTELEVWKKAHQLVLLVYKITSKFPKNEQFGLTSQIRRAAISVAANIVEGFYKSSPWDSLRFYNIAEASLEEVKYYILLANDLELIVADEYNLLKIKSSETGAYLCRWMQAIRKHCN